MLRLKSAVVLGIFLSLPACSSEDLRRPVEPALPVVDEGCSTDADCGASSGGPRCDIAAGACAPQAYELGRGDGSPSSVTLTVIYEPPTDKLREPTDLAWNPAEPRELWVVNRKDDSVIVIQDAGLPEASAQRYKDPAANHFMNNPPALAFGVESHHYGMTWATCGDNDNGGSDFMGPTLFSADLSVFAVATPDGLGSHLDMLHSTSFCRGIAHERDNVYWVFNSDKKSLDKYDFAADHGPGNDDHADGEIYRYVRGQVVGVEGVSSHLYFNAEDRHLYIADTGNKRVAKLDTESGTLGASFSGQEPVEARKIVNDALMHEVVRPGTLEAPSGIELKAGLIYVSDSATSYLYAFDAQGEVIRSLDTGLPPGSLSGLSFGPDGRIYFVDVVSARVYRIDPVVAP
jgi:DNA-binding beta-propeller fold protein YncE